MSLNNRYLVTFIISSHSSLLLLAHVFNKIPTDPYGNYMAAIFGSQLPWFMQLV